MCGDRLQQAADYWQVIEGMKVDAAAGGCQPPYGRGEPGRGVAPLGASAHIRFSPLWKISKIRK